MKNQVIILVFLVTLAIFFCHLENTIAQDIRCATGGLYLPGCTESKGNLNAECFQNKTCKGNNTNCTLDTVINKLFCIRQPTPNKSGDRCITLNTNTTRNGSESNSECGGDDLTCQRPDKKYFNPPEARCACILNEDRNMTKVLFPNSKDFSQPSCKTVKELISQYKINYTSDPEWCGAKACIVKTPSIFTFVVTILAFLAVRDYNTQ